MSQRKASVPSVEASTVWGPPTFLDPWLFLGGHTYASQVSTGTSPSQRALWPWGWRADVHEPRVQVKAHKRGREETHHPAQLSR